MAVGAVMEMGTAAGGLLDELLILLASGADDFALAFEGVCVITRAIRRKVLEQLVEHGVQNRCELAEAVVDDEDLPVEDIEELEIELHHRHLPILEDDGYVEYDWRNGDVALWEDTEAVEALLREK